MALHVLPMDIPCPGGFRFVFWFVSCLCHGLLRVVAGKKPLP